jgi:hypothetical protein
MTAPKLLSVKIGQDVMIGKMSTFSERWYYGYDSRRRIIEPL